MGYAAHNLDNRTILDRHTADELARDYWEGTFEADYGFSPAGLLQGAKLLKARAQRCKAQAGLNNYANFDHQARDLEQMAADLEYAANPDTHPDDVADVLPSIEEWLGEDFELSRAVGQSTWGMA